MQNEIILQNEISVFVKERVISLQPQYTNPVVGNVDHDYLEVNFDHEWDNLDKRVTFYGVGVEAITMPLDENDRAVIPWECLQSAGMMGLTFVGSENGVDRLVTIDLDRDKRLRVLPSGEDMGVTPSEPTPDLYQRMKEFLEVAESKIGYVVLTADDLLPNGIPNIEKPVEGTIYYAPIPEEEQLYNYDGYVEWVWIESKWNRLGSQTFDIQEDADDVKDMIDDIFYEEDEETEGNDE